MLWYPLLFLKHCLWQAFGGSCLRIKHKGKEVVIVINEQIVKLPKGQQNASATQVASGAGTFSTGGTNSAIESSGTKQQHAVGGNGIAMNKWGKKSRGKSRRKR